MQIESTYRKLKFEDKFTIGQTIRAEDFEPLNGRPTFFIEGTILSADTTCRDQPYAFYLIRITADTDNEGNRTTEGGRVGNLATVPMETGMDWDSRIQLAE